MAKAVQHSVSCLTHPREILVYMSSYGNLNINVIGNFIPDGSREREGHSLPMSLGSVSCRVALLLVLRN